MTKATVDKLVGGVLLAGFAAGMVGYGGGKTNGAPQNLNAPLAPPAEVHPLVGLARSIWPEAFGSAAHPVRLAHPAPLTDAEKMASNWNARGAWQDSFRLDFDEGWVFPWGTNHLTSVEVLSYGEIRPQWNDTNAVARLGVPVSIVPGLTHFSFEQTPSNSCRFAWADATVGRVPRGAMSCELMTAAVELFRNGDVAVTTNGVTWTIPRELPFAHDGYGQDAAWVAANFTNATEIAAAGGYPAWVDAQVGEGLTNGLYKLTVAVADDPLEAMQIAVGDMTIAVTNAGEYAFLLEKGTDYGLTVSPASTNVTIVAVDDIPAVRGPSLLRSGAGGAERNGVWTPDGGLFATDYAAGLSFARLWWPPWLCGAPDTVHIDPRAGAVDFSALLRDYGGSGASFQWAASDGLTVAAPSAQTTGVTADGGTDWELAEMSVTATFGSGRSLTSHLRVSYGTNDSPQVSCSIAVQNVHFINEGGRTERVYPVSLSLLCPVETNGTVDVEWSGGDGARFWTDADATAEVFLPTNIPVGSVARGSGQASFSFYMTSPQVGSGELIANFTLPSGETRGVGKGYRVIEPLRKLVTAERDSVTGQIFNPSRLVHGQPARLKVGVNGNFSPEDVEWRVVSGPGVVTRGEDEFGSADWTATVEATAASGEVVVEARFNADAIQPQFVLPIVQMRQMPIEAYVVCDTNGIGATTQAAIEEKIAFANIVWAQAGIAFYLSGDAVELHCPQYLNIAEYNTVTNASGALVPGRIQSSDVTVLLGLAPFNGCIRTFWVRDFTDSDAGAFSLPWERALFMSEDGSLRVLAHELGHVLDLRDIYDYRKRRNAAIYMTGYAANTDRGCFSDRTRDWGAESECGFYQVNDTQSAILRSLLMYGYDNRNVSSAVDIPSGAVWGLGMNARSSLSTTHVNVGADSINAKEN